MEGLNRKILYRKESDAKVPAKKAAPVDINIYTWLSSHPLINVSGLAMECSIDRANLSRWIREGNIPEKHLSKLAEVLQQYGYVKQ